MSSSLLQTLNKNNLIPDDRTNFYPLQQTNVYTTTYYPSTLNKYDYRPEASPGRTFTNSWWWTDPTGLDNFLYEFFLNWFYGPNTGSASRCKYCTVGSFFFLWLIVFLVNSTSAYKDKNTYGPFCSAFVAIWLEMALTTATVYGWNISVVFQCQFVLSQGGGCVLGSMAAIQQHTICGCTLSKARGGLLERECLSGEAHPSWDRVAMVRWMTHSSWDRLSGTPSCQQLFSFSFPFLIFHFFMFLEKQTNKTKGLSRAVFPVCQQNLFILQEILFAAFFGNMQFSWWETTHKQSALPKEAFQNVSSLNWKKIIQAVRHWEK